MSASRLRLAALLAAVVVAGACRGGGGASASQPAPRAVEAYLDALAADDPVRAYAMLSAAVKKEMPYEAFALRWREYQAERKEQVASLGDGLRSDGDLGERAKITFADGKTATLRREGGSWRLESGLLSATHASSPHVAIELFADALGARSYDDVMRVLTARRRDGLGRQVDLFVTSLRKHLADARHRVEFVGKDRAELAWDDGELHYKVVLRLEGDEWRVDDVHLQAVPAAPTP
jgi:hypothetical protein